MPAAALAPLPLLPLQGPPAAVQRRCPAPPACAPGASCRHAQQRRRENDLLQRVSSGTAGGNPVMGVCSPIPLRHTPHE